MEKLKPNDTIKLTMSSTGYTLWKCNKIVNEFEEYVIFKENIQSLDEVMKFIPKNKYLEFYFKQDIKSNGKIGRYDPM